MISKLPKGWKEIDLGEIVEIISGGTPRRKEESYWNGDIPWISVKDFPTDGKYIKKTEEKITGKGLENSSTNMLNLNDIIISARGTVGKLGVVQKPMAFNQSCYGLRSNELMLNNDFFYYFLKYDIERLKRQGHGSVFNTIIISTLKNLSINVPSLLEQKVIADTLSAIDNKIENNNKVNENLEQQAQEIFKYWFVDFEFPDKNGMPYKSSGGEMMESEFGMIPKEWNWVELNEIADLTMGLSPKSDTYNFEEVGLPLLNGASDFENGLIKPTKHTSKPTRISKKDDLVFCIRATIGNLTFADEEYCIGRGVAALTPKTENYKGIMYYNLLNSIQRLISNASGSVILGLTKADINNMKLLYSDEKTLNMFSDITNTIFKRKKVNELETEKLSVLRDTLLPKLMSGELQIPLDE